MSGLVGNPEDRFSHNAALMSDIISKPVIGGFRPGSTQTGLYSCRGWLESPDFGFRKDDMNCIGEQRGLSAVQ